tara:strand:- start:588 stop:1295 length:708 start_codon:yes stop_codon:yes gene_type:complete
MAFGNKTYWCRFLQAVSVALLVGVWVPGAVHAAGPAPQPSFFHSVEVRSSNMAPFKKWNAALARYSKEGAATKVQCSSRAMDICSYDDWLKFLATLKDAAPLVQLNEINKRINQASYITDSTNWGQKDYWATPAEFMSRFGDCEDYAILKYLSLRRLGWPEDDLRVVAVKDLNLKVGHAVLVAFFKHPKTGQILPLLLDNQIKKIVVADKVRHYQPVFSLNKKSWWRHTPVSATN